MSFRDLTDGEVLALERLANECGPVVLSNRLSMVFRRFAMHPELEGKPLGQSFDVAADLYASTADQLVVRRQCSPTVPVSP